MRFTGFFGAISLVTACSSFEGAPKPIVEPKAELASLVGVLEIEKAIENDNFIKKAIEGRVGVIERNNYILAKMYAIDLRYREFEKDLSQEARQSDFFVTLASIGLTGTATLVAGTAGSILAGIDTGLKGTSEAFSRDILIDRTVTALTNQMRADRSKMRTLILGKLTQSVADYPPFLALGQVEDYYTAGTLYGAVAGLNELVAAKAEDERKKELRAAEEFTIRREAILPNEIGEAIDDFLKADPAANAPKLRACFDNRKTVFATGSRPPSAGNIRDTAATFPEFTTAIATCLNSNHDANISIGG